MLVFLCIFYKYTAKYCKNYTNYPKKLVHPVIFLTYRLLTPCSHKKDTVCAQFSFAAKRCAMPEKSDTHTLYYTLPVMPYNRILLSHFIDMDACYNRLSAKRNADIRLLCRVTARLCQKNSLTVILCIINGYIIRICLILAGSTIYK